MDDELRNSLESPIDGAPTWVRVVQAVLIGLVAGFALHLLLSMVVLQGRELGPGSKELKQCRKNTPAGSAQLALPSEAGRDARSPFVYPRNIS